MTGAEAIARAVPHLSAAGVPDPMRDARRLLAHALGIAPDRLALALRDPISADAAARFDGLVGRRAAREPISHLTGSRIFWGREFRVTPDVLDPRPETETLIAEALSVPFERALDLGTGSGCILLTLLAERSSATGVGTDLSPAALAVAEDNAVRHGLDHRARFAQGSWTAALDPEDRFDLVVSNPPYIAASEMDGPRPRGAPARAGPRAHGWRRWSHGLPRDRPRGSRTHDARVAAPCRNRSEPERRCRGDPPECGFRRDLQPERYGRPSPCPRCHMARIRGELTNFSVVAGCNVSADMFTQP